MKQTADDIGAYEGLVFTTSARYSPYLDDSPEDIAQELRVKVWRALQSYDPARATQTLDGYVFSCVVNRVKDLLKVQSRLNARRNGGALYIEDCASSSPAAFEAEHFSSSGDLADEIADAESVELPSTLTPYERRVTVLLLLDLRQAEIAMVLGVPRSRVRAAHSSVREKLADWSPSSPPEPLPVSLPAQRLAA